MTNEQKILVENTLGANILLYHEIEDEDKMRRYIREDTIKFCREHNIDINEVIPIIKNMIKHKRDNTIFKYEKYGNIEEIMLGDDRER